MVINSQNGKSVYSDGNEVEKKMLEIAKEYPEDASQDYIANDSHYTVNNTFSAVRHNILNWYPFQEDAEILEVGAGMGSITGMLCNKVKHVTSIEMNDLRAEVIRARYPERKNLDIISEDITTWDTEKKFDYVVFIGVLEYAGVFSDSETPFIDFMKAVKAKLKQGGKVLFAIENRFGLKYWLGAAEDHLQEPFVGIEGYRKPHTPRTFSKEELKHILEEAGLKENRFYYVLPDYKFPTAIFTDEFLPSYNEVQKIHFTYSKGSKLLFDEKLIYKDIIENGRFDFFANSYLIEASSDKLDENHIIHVSARGECKKEYRIITTIDDKKNIIKEAVCKEAEKHLLQTFENTEYLQSRGIKVLNYKYENGKLQSDYFDGMHADKIFEKYLLEKDRAHIYTLIDELKKNVMASSSISNEKLGILEKLDVISQEEREYDYGPVLEKGFIDMTFYNAFYKNGELIFFDQEWMFEQVPMKFIIYYALRSIYNRSTVKTDISLDELLTYIGIGQERAVYERLEEKIWGTVLNRQTDFYGEDGYCNRFTEELTLDRNIEEEKRKIAEEKEQEKKEVERQKEEVERQKEEVERQKEEVERQKEEMEQQKNEMIARQAQEINNKTGHIEQLMESERRLQQEIKDLRNSHSWRLISKFHPIARAIAPSGSKRRLVLKIAGKCLRHPIRVAKKISPSRVRNMFIYLKTDGTEGVSRRMDECLIGNEIQPYQLDIVNEVDTKKSLEEYEKLVFEKFDRPVVSIIIPVYNQFEYTYECLKSIQKNSKDIAYEIIIADDCSTDFTAELEKIVQGITVQHNKENLRFLRNCNQAAEMAKGEYILFLNNDTQVQEEWLSSLIQLMESSQEIGMVGSKLVYPDGRLQEAGGILWKDGSAWNYGNRNDANASEYNYVKEADYISGAAIMIRAALWNEIGGFDDRYAPAYCEDSDLAFEVRKHGYKVMYQPKSVVVHFEGISNGTDTSQGQKAYQITNQKKFMEKWKEVLEKEHFKNAEHIFLARDKSAGKPVLLMVDHYVPQFDKDAGSRTVYQYLKLFVQMGFNVKFIGDNFYQHEPYTTALQQLGIEVLYGPYYANNWKKWVENNAEDIKYVFLNRPHISVKYIEFLKEHTKAKIIYYGHDLHFLREMRKYELTKDKTALHDSEDWKRKELKLMKQADVVYYPSEVEVKEIHKIDTSIPAKAIPAYLFDDIVKEEYQYASRKDIMFIGGFVHTPNVDAVEWLAKEIMPHLIEKIPDIKIYILGSHPTETIKALANEHLIVKGFVSDEELDAYYHNTRISIVPLRYGAGIKGKVIEAMKFGMPVVTTSVGAEGIVNANQILAIEDDPVKLADRIVRLYEDEGELDRMSKASYDYIEQYFSSKNAIEVIGKDFGIHQ